MATKQELLETAIDLAEPNFGINLADTRDMKGGVYKDTIHEAIRNIGATDADLVYKEFHRLAGLRGHTRKSFDRFLPEVLAAKGI